MTVSDIYRIKVFPNLDLYKPFHDYRWSKEVIDPLVTGTKVEAITIMLLSQWLKASAGFRYPSLMMDSLKATNHAYLDRYTPYTNTIMEGLTGLIQREYKSEVTVTAFNKLMIILEGCKTRLQNEVPNNDVFYDSEKAFLSNLNVSPEFGLSLVAITEQAFCSIYFAYELFIKRCYQLLTNDLKTKASSPEFSDKLNAALKDDTLHAMLWTCDDVIDAKEARHTIAHADGEAGPKLKTHDAYYEIAPATNKEPSKMHISTPGVHILYQNLQIRVEKMIRYMLAMP